MPGVLPHLSINTDLKYCSPPSIFSMSKLKEKLNSIIEFGIDKG